MNDSSRSSTFRIPSRGIVDADSLFRSKKRRAFKFFLILIILILGVLSGFSATKTFTNTSGGPWTTASNWSPSGVPANGDDVILPTLSSSATAITGVPTMTLGSLTCTGSGYGWLQAGTTGNTVTISNTWSVPSTYTLTIGTAGARLVWTLSSACLATLNGYVAFDAGNTTRDFTVNGILIINSTGMLYDPNPSGGSDFILASGATLKTQKAQGITTTAATSTATINYNVAVSFGGTYNYASGANYEFNGTSNQSTGTGLNQNTPNSVVVNLSSGRVLTLSGSTAISSSLTLTSGLVNLAGNTLTLGTSGAATGTLSLVSGNFMYGGTFTRWFATSVVSIPSNSGLFPMGTSNGDYRPLWVGYSSNLTTAGNISVVHTATYPATYVAATHSDVSWGNPVKGVSNSVWTISTNSISFNGSTGMVRYGGYGFGTNSLTDLDASLVSSVTGSHSAATNVNVTYEVNRTNITTAIIANGWRIGSRNINASPLPVTLMDFSASRNESGHVDLKWNTVSELNNDHFVVERMNDGKTIEAIGQLKGAGTTAMAHSYSFCDRNAGSSESYYRLRMVDFFGASDFSEWRVLGAENEKTALSIWPNPSSDLLHMHISGENSSAVTIRIFNASGENVYSSDKLTESINLENLPVGVYNLLVTTGGKSYSKKIVRQ